MDSQNYRLPFEILEIIIKEVHSMDSKDVNKLKTLRSCLFVSSIFRFMAVKRLYQTVQLNDFDLLSPTTDELLALLHQVINPPMNFRFGSVVRYIKIFELRIFYVSQSQLLAFFEEEKFLSIIRSLSGEDYGINRCSLSLMNVHSSFSGPASIWPRLSIDSQSVLRSLIQSRRLITLEISGFHGFPEEILRGSQLQVLQLRAFRSIKSEDNLQYLATSHSTSEASPYPALKVLKTDNSFTFDMSPQSILRRLEKLVIEMVRQDQAQRIHDIINFTRNTLRDIEIRTQGVVLLPNLIALDRLPELRNLLYNVEYCQLSAQCYHLFSVVSPVTLLKRVQLEYYHFVFLLVDTREDYTIDFAVNPFIEFFEVGGDTLDCLLSGPNYPSLHAVEVEVKLVFSVRPAPTVDSINFDSKAESKKHSKAITDSVFKAFPRLATQANMDFKVKVDVQFT